MPLTTLQNSSNALRQRSFRRRCAAGRVCVTVEVDEIGLGELLTAAGLLKLGADGRSDLAVGLQRLVDALIAEHCGRLR